MVLPEGVGNGFAGLAQGKLGRTPYLGPRLKYTLNRLD
jgi:hypothetical protein